MYRLLLLLFVFGLLGCSDDPVQIEQPHGVQLESSVENVYTTECEVIVRGHITNRGDKTAYEVQVICFACGTFGTTFCSPSTLAAGDRGIYIASMTLNDCPGWTCNPAPSAIRVQTYWTE